MDFSFVLFFKLSKYEKDQPITVVRLIKTKSSDGLVNHGKNRVSFITRLVKFLNSNEFIQRVEL